MSQPTYQGSTAQQLIDFARENGVELPDGTSKNDAWAEVKKILADLGQKPLEQDSQSAEQSKPAAATTQVAAEKTLTHFTISVSRPTDTKLQDFTVCANGTNYQIHFGKKVKVPAVVVSILNDAIERIPAHRDMETGEWIDEAFEPRYSFVIHEEHFE